MDEDISANPQELNQGTSVSSPNQAMSKYSWKHIGLGLIVIFLIAMGTFVLGRKTADTSPVSKIPVNPKATELTNTQNSKLNSLRCGIAISYPSEWNARETTLIPGKDNIENGYGCIDILAPDYNDDLHSPEGFFMNVTRTKLGTAGNKITITTLEDYISSEENTSEPMTPAKNKTHVTYGSLSGTQYDVSFYLALTHFITIHNGFIYDITWPTSYIGVYKDNIGEIISSIKPLDVKDSANQSDTTTWLTYSHKAAGFSIKYPANRFSLCDNLAANDLGAVWFWPKGWDCNTATDASYDMLVMLQTKENYNKNNFSKKPASETTILLDGRQAKYIKYVFTDEDGQLGSIGEIRQVILETEKGVYELQIPGKDFENVRLFDEMIKTFKLMN